MATRGEGMGFPGGSVGKNPPANAGATEDEGLIPGWGRPPREGNSDPLQYSCQDNPTDKGAWRVTVTELQRVRHHWEAGQACRRWGDREAELDEGSQKV